MIASIKRPLFALKPIQYASLQTSGKEKSLLVSDLDLCLLSQDPTVNQDLLSLGKTDKLTLWYDTGRTYSKLTELKGKIPEPQYTIGDLGCSIYKGLPSPEDRPDQEYDSFLETLGFNRKALFSSASTILQNHKIEFETRPDQSHHNLRLYLKTPGLDEAVIKSLVAAIEEGAQKTDPSIQLKGTYFKHHKKPYWVINFSPPKVDKNFAVEFLLKRHPEITSQNILVAGDDVVDIPLFKEGRTIFVPSQQKEVLEQVNQLKCSKVYKISSPGQEHGRWLIDTLKEHLKKVLGAE